MPHRATSQCRDATTQRGFGLDEAAEKPFQRLTREIPGLELNQPGAANCAARHEPVDLQTLEGLLNSGDRRLQQASQLARIALPDQVKCQQHPRSRLTTEWTRRFDHHERSYDH